MIFSDSIVDYLPWHMSFEVYSQKIKVTKQHIDELDHVNNVVYLQWAQEVASEHWHYRASPEMKEKFRWVVLKHEIFYFAPAFLDDEIELKTYIEGSDGARSVRIVEFIKERKPIAKASTEWCLIQAIPMKPHRIDQAIVDIFKQK